MHPIQSFILYLDNILRYNIPYLIMCYGHLCVFFVQERTNRQKVISKDNPNEIERESNSLTIFSETIHEERRQHCCKASDQMFFFCNQLKFKNRNTNLTTIKQPSSSDKVVWCHSLCKKVFETRLSRASREDAEGNLENSQQEPSIPNLSEILLNEGMLGLHKYHGPFVYTHIPLASLTHGTESQQSTQRILAQKALFEIVSSLNGENAQKSGTHLRTGNKKCL